MAITILIGILQAVLTFILSKHKTQASESTALQIGWLQEILTLLPKLQTLGADGVAVWHAFTVHDLPGFLTALKTILADLESAIPTGA